MTEPTSAGPLPPAHPPRVAVKPARSAHMHHRSLRRNHQRGHTAKHALSGFLEKTATVDQPATDRVAQLPTK